MCVLVTTEWPWHLSYTVVACVSVTRASRVNGITMNWTSRMAFEIPEWITVDQQNFAISKIYTSTVIECFRIVLCSCMVEPVIWNILDFQAAFDQYDKDGSNAISLNELGTVLKNLGLNPSEKDLKKLMKKHDQDGELFFLNWRSK